MSSLRGGERAVRLEQRHQIADGLVLQGFGRVLESELGRQNESDLHVREGCPASNRLPRVFVSQGTAIDGQEIFKKAAELSLGHVLSSPCKRHAGAVVAGEPARPI